MVDADTLIKLAILENDIAAGEFEIYASVPIQMKDS